MSLSLHGLPKKEKRSARRVGRGYGSGRAKTAGRGEKGQKKRSKVKPGFEGGQLKLIKRLPFVRGCGFKSTRLAAWTVGLEGLNVFKNDSRVDLQRLVEVGLVPPKFKGQVKILARGQLAKRIALIGLAVSQSVREQVEKLGGEVL